ncbi:hypothetical protein [Orrella dioscoreae]|uniref:hypothetical protein n=1 Tax=Orrella dioscoreae TaxID=1851544 RepID=UPI000833E3B5|nr:hypothetical protein [Orrella dioscoreae]
MKPTFQDMLKDLVSQGMTQSSIADSIGVTQGAISQVLNSDGQRGFRYEAGKKLTALHKRRTRAPSGPAVEVEHA